MTLAHYDIYYCTSWADVHSGSNTWTQLNGSSKGAASAFTRKVDWIPGGPLEFPVEAPPVGTRSGGLQSTTTTYGDARQGTLRITSVYGGADTGADRRAEMQDEWATLVSTITPSDGEILIRFDRPDRSANTLSRVLICRVSATPEWRALSDRADSETIVVEIGMEVLYPMFIDRTESGGSYEGVGTSFSSNTLTNSGHMDGQGFTVIVDAVNSGSPTIITMENTTTGKTLIWTAATIFTVNDRLSWFGDDPRKVQITSANASHLGASAAGSDPSLRRGSNTFKVKVNAGNVDIIVNRGAEYFTP